ncbi:MAG: ABC transporter ATP-binding protein [Candidatus Melainabacteria bacterium]|nr:ABC transporter ATP-binding protein [Candidatus Melainabacteria bacterium]
MATIVDPNVLLVDVYLALGDMNFQVKCFKKFMSLQEAGKTIILVTHDMVAVAKHCHHVVLLNGGSIVAKGVPERVIPLYDELMAKSGAIAPKIIAQAVSTS